MDMNLRELWNDFKITNHSNLRTSFLSCPDEERILNSIIEKNDALGFIYDVDEDDINKTKYITLNELRKLKELPSNITNIILFCSKYNYFYTLNYIINNFPKEIELYFDYEKSCSDVKQYYPFKDNSEDRYSLIAYMLRIIHFYVSEVIDTQIHDNNTFTFEELTMIVILINNLMKYENFNYYYFNHMTNFKTSVLFELLFYFSILKNKINSTDESSIILNEYILSCTKNIINIHSKYHLENIKISGLNSNAEKILFYLIMYSYRDSPIHSNLYPEHFIFRIKDEYFTTILEWIIDEIGYIKSKNVIEIIEKHHDMFLFTYREEEKQISYTLRNKFNIDENEVYVSDIVPFSENEFIISLDEDEESDLYQNDEINKESEFNLLNYYNDEVVSESKIYKNVIEIKEFRKKYIEICNNYLLNKVNDYSNDEYYKIEI